MHNPVITSFAVAKGVKDHTVLSVEILSTYQLYKTLQLKKMRTLNISQVSSDL